MSRVVSQIRATDTGRRHIKKIPLSKMMSIEDSVNKETVYTSGIEYKIEVKFGARAIIDYDKRSDELRYAIDATKTNVIEFIFGEFRPYFGELNMALWENDIDAAREILSNFEKQMFEKDSFE